MVEASGRVRSRRASEDMSGFLEQMASIERGSAWRKPPCVKTSVPSSVGHGEPRRGRR